VAVGKVFAALVGAGFFFIPLYLYFIGGRS
jgi:hypothetical protein